MTIDKRRLESSNESMATPFPRTFNRNIRVADSFRVDEKVA